MLRRGAHGDLDLGQQPQAALDVERAQRRPGDDGDLGESVGEPHGRFELPRGRPDRLVRTGGERLRRRLAAGGQQTRTGREDDVLGRRAGTQQELLGRPRGGLFGQPTRHGQGAGVGDACACAGQRLTRAHVRNGHALGLEQCQRGIVEKLRVFLREHAQGDVRPPRQWGSGCVDGGGCPGHVVTASEGREAAGRRGHSTSPSLAPQPDPGRPAGPPRRTVAAQGGRPSAGERARGGSPRHEDRSRLRTYPRQRRSGDEALCTTRHRGRRRHEVLLRRTRDRPSHARRRLHDARGFAPRQRRAPARGRHRGAHPPAAPAGDQRSRPGGRALRHEPEQRGRHGEGPVGRRRRAGRGPPGPVHGRHRRPPRGRHAGGGRRSLPADHGSAGHRPRRPRHQPQLPLRRHADP